MIVFGQGIKTGFCCKKKKFNSCVRFGPVAVGSAGPVPPLLIDCSFSSSYIDNSFKKFVTQILLNDHTCNDIRKL